ncbi:MAG: hypothetical protein ACHQ16_08170, partial [Candidatus Lutacidiplasmatales archaeon]
SYYPVYEVVWVYAAGAWSPVTSPGPSEQLGAQTAFDYGDGYLLFFGGLGTGGITNDTWSFLGGTWTQLFASAGFATTLAAQPPLVDLGHTIAFTTTVTGPNESYSFSYAGLPPGCGGVNLATFLCTPTTVGTYLISVTVRNSTGGSSVSSVGVSVSPALALVSFGPIVPTYTVGGGAVRIDASVYGGTPTYRFQYAFNIPGCTPTTLLGAGTSASLYCTPTTSGEYSLALNVSDAAGSSVFGASNLTVYSSNPPSGPPTIVSFYARPATLVVGQSVSFFVSATGSPPFTYDFIGLPTGCTRVNASSFGCAPNETGTFGVLVLVTDPNYRSASANTTLVVLPANGSPPALMLDLFAAEPAMIQTGQTTYFLVSVEGGTPPY